MKLNKNMSLGGSFSIFAIGQPNFNELTKTEKRLLLVPLVDVVRDFYKDEINRAKYQKWLAENYPNE